ncbi:MAG: hypothetical protein SFH39_00120 [Candidatus Magnetobacterium sp. LHC-1]
MASKWSGSAGDFLKMMSDSNNKVVRSVNVSLQNIDGRIIEKSNVTEVKTNCFGNIQLVFDNGKVLTFQSSLWTIKSKSES